MPRRPTRTFRGIGGAMFPLAGFCYAKAQGPLWILPAATLLVIVVVVTPIWNHNGQVKYGDDW